MSDVLKGLATVSHEVRSPLNGIVCMASLLADTDLDPDQKDLVQVILNSAQNLAKILDDLLEFSRLCENDPLLERKPFDIKNMCVIVVKNLETTCQDKDIDFIIDIDENSRMFLGDRVRMSEILTNLLNNSIKFTKKGYVRISARNEDDYLVLKVTDSGIGIPKESQTDIFNNFVQLHPDYRASGSGIGLGLSIVKRLVEIMGGFIEVESNPGKGSEFTLRLPNLYSGETGDTEDETDILEKYTFPEDISVLLVDDEQVNRFYLRVVFERFKWKIDEAVNGEQAIKLAAKNRYDIILMDVSMPKMDGMEATKRIKKISPETPVIGVTAHAFQEDIVRFLASGMDQVVIKPIDDRELMDALHFFLVGQKI